MHNFDRTLEVISQIDRCRTSESLLLSLTSFTGQYGLERLIAGTIPPNPEPVDALKDRFLLSGFSQEWLQRYLTHNYVHIDPVIQGITRTPIPFRWSEIAKDVGDSGRKVMHEAREFKLMDGLAVPLWTTDYVAAVSLSGERVEMSPEERGMVTLVSIYAITKAMALKKHREDHDRPRLTARELECLKWVAAGKTEWEVAQILTISESTADKHLASVNRKLGVYGRPHAVAEAFRRGLIS